MPFHSQFHLQFGLGSALALLLWAPVWCAQAAPAQAGGPCNTSEQRQFDFWIGEWDVSEDGKPAGRNSVRAVLGGCALTESWVGVDSMHGQSINTYDSSRAVWHQTWTDDRGLLLVLEGWIRNGAMVLEGERIAADTKQRTRERITWSKLGNGDVRQLWEYSGDGGRSWQTRFNGNYHRR